MMMFVQLIVVISIVAATANNIGYPALPGCNNKCGNLTIPYPFGMSPECYLNINFSIACDTTHSDLPQAFLMDSDIKVTNISFLTGELDILQYTAEYCYEPDGTVVSNRPSLTVPMFTISSTKNMFTVIGCNTYAYIYGKLKGQSYTSGCMALCKNIESVNDGRCSGSGCCQLEIPRGLKNLELDVRNFNDSSNSQVSTFNPCGYAFVIQQDSFNFSKNYIKSFENETVPLVLDWTIIGGNICGANAIPTNYSDNGYEYRCQCSKGFDGNPYLSQGCQDIDECENGSHECESKEQCVNTPGNYTCSCPKNYNGDGIKGRKGCTRNIKSFVSIIIGIGVGFIVLLVGTTWLYLGYKKWKFIQKKEKFFKQNGGFILQQHLSQPQSPVDTVKIFSQEELDKATNKFDETTVIGIGGYGTVHKGVLEGGSFVAIKKSKIVDQSQIDQFINEVIILSQINHRHVVRLLGCCLETEVPLLVYEFINNGTLFDHIHNNSLPWEARLKIASETAGVISYLHSSASTPIIHRDIKSTNILLDANFTAKVSDFGASKLVPTNQTQLSTMVQGTLGYLDPEYLLTSELTEKSDVYSFGIVLLELITGKKAVRFDGPEIERNLAMYVLCAMKEGRLVEVVDKRMEKERFYDQINEVAKLAKECVRVKGEERPSMKEVAMELEGLRVMQVEHSWTKNSFNAEEIVNLVDLDLESTQQFVVNDSINLMDNSIRAQAFTHIPNAR